MNVVANIHETEALSTVSMPELPNEVWMKIFTYLSYGDLEQTKVVCKHWCQLVHSLQFRYKTKLVITLKNVKNICLAIENHKQLSIPLHYENVELDMYVIKSEYLVKIFENLKSCIRQLKLYNFQLLFVLNDYLPELEVLILMIHCERVLMPGLDKEQRSSKEKINQSNNTSLDLYKFPKLKSLDISFDLITMLGDNSNDFLKNLTLMPFKHLERLSIQFDDILEELVLEVIEGYAHSLRWLDISLLSSPSKFKWQEIVKKFTQLEVLKIDQINVEKWLIDVLENFPKESCLRTIVLGGFPDMDDLLKLITRKWFNSLEYLHLRASRNLTDVGIKQLNLITNKLRCLTLCNCESLTVQGILQGIAANKPNRMLCSLNLNLNNIQGLTEDFIYVLVQNLPNLTTLKLANCDRAISITTMAYIFCNLTQLQHLSLGHYGLSFEDRGNDFVCCEKPVINYMKGLQSLRSCFCAIVAISSLNVTFNELRKLVVRECCNYLPNFVHFNTYFPALEELTFSYWNLKFDCFTELVHNFPRLRKLDFKPCNPISGDFDIK
uniref:F-box domain-containing protein n=1 Tax=Glossina brevipalpis TaxID=37001 RepID=A0A1A9X2D2_9MUSC